MRAEFALLAEQQLSEVVNHPELILASCLSQELRVHYTNYNKVVVSLCVDIGNAGYYALRNLKQNVLFEG